jgi:hypothetical protein
MFNKLLQKLRSLSSKRNINRFDPSRFGDPIAMQADWTPAHCGGANFRTHKLVHVNSNRLEFRASIAAKAFFLSFIIIGGGVGLSSANLSFAELSFDIDAIMPLLFGFIFLAAGSCMLYFVNSPIVFDKQLGFFWKGRAVPDKVSDRKSIKHFSELEKIHALQIISKYCSDSDSSYFSYELNIVLENGKRINVVDHGNQNKLREDARILSAFLEKPVWDAT